MSSTFREYVVVGAGLYELLLLGACGPPSAPEAVFRAMPEILFAKQDGNELLYVATDRDSVVAFRAQGATVEIEHGR